MKKMKMACVKITATRSAVLILLWDYLMYCHIAYLRYYVATYMKQSLHDISWINIIFDLCYCLLFMMFPLFGLLADVKIGRYNAITFGIIMCFVSWIIAGIGVIINEAFCSTPLFLIAFFFAYLTEVISYSCFKVNIIQYNIDQLVEASSNQISIFIYLHTARVAVAVMVLQILRCSISNMNTVLICFFILSGVAVSFVLITHSLFKGHLQNISLVDNPIELIIKILNYARKHKYPVNRSALTYWEEKSPSRLDLGKRKYGGPFSEEKVENVKTVLRLLPLIFIGVLGLGFSRNTNWATMCDIIEASSVMECLRKTDFFIQTTYVSLIFLFIAVSYHCYYKCLPNMLKRIGIGLLFALAFVLLSCFFIHENTQHNKLRYTNEFIISDVLYGIANSITFPTLLEFTIAQTPIEMRGLMVGLFYMALGIGFGASINLSYAFSHCDIGELCSNFRYYIAKSCIIFIVFVSFIVLAKRYKYRVRENEVNIHQIVDDHYQRYMDQADVHNNNKPNI